ncbi:MAG: hypothetical protein BJ554DRAFT_6713 [Olpidium bornovanus]|uniref:S1 motif domain-containing protein n=1 Tax=Olpidium bornovanus TaxID=278681 RepID=A0A8H8A1Q4_9FUNG|nr:MAG: hypothetical protein BJ554DRAFT_6713 [Olpidium bornovanus]
MLFHGVVSAIKEKGAVVSFYAGVRGYVRIGELWYVFCYTLAVTQTSGDVQLSCFSLSPSDAYVKMPSEVVTVGQTVRCRILSVDPKNKRMQISLKDVLTLPELGDSDHNVQSGADEMEETNKKKKEKLTKIRKVEHLAATYETLKEGSTVPGRVTRVRPEIGLSVLLGENLHGSVPLTEIADEFTTEPTAGFKPGDDLTFHVIKVDKENGRVCLSLRPSRVNGTGDAVDPVVENAKDVKRGSVCRGYVFRHLENGVLVSVGRNVRAHVDKHQVAEKPSENWKADVPLGALVKGKVTAFKDGKLYMSLKSGIVEKLKKKNKKVQKEQKDVRAGDDNENEVEGKNRDRDAAMPGITVADIPAVASSRKASHPVHALEVKAGFRWDGEDDPEDEDDDDAASVASAVESDATDGDDESDMDGSRKRKKRQKKKAPTSADLVARAQAESEASDLTRAPQVAADHERLLVGSPNSSYLWINYMAFQLHLSEVDKARAVGERALKTINFREGQERMNVWVAMMNLEDRYGDEGTLDAVVKRAAQAADPKHVYLALVKVFDRGEKLEVRLSGRLALFFCGESGPLSRLSMVLTAPPDLPSFRTPKRFSPSSRRNSTPRVRFGSYTVNSSTSTMTTTAPANCSSEASKACRSTNLVRILPPPPPPFNKKDIKAILKFAQMEYRLGDIERGRTLFEGMLTTHPKRVDLWNVYLDKEMRLNDKDFVRRLFQRITGLHISSKKMKHFFKRWLAYEKQHGDETSQAAVKEAAVRYVESKV